MSTAKAVEEFFRWRDVERRKHRYMTVAEHRAWCIAGGILSHPYSSNAFPGGITIDFSSPDSGIFGTTTPRVSNA